MIIVIIIIVIVIIGLIIFIIIFLGTDGHLSVIAFRFTTRLIQIADHQIR